MNGEPVKVLDQEVLDLLQDAIGDSVQNIITLYIEEVPKDLAQMQAALDQGDFKTIHRLAHSLKASSANLGAMQTSYLSAELEHSISDGEKAPELVRELINKLLMSYDQTRTILLNYIEL